MNHLKIFVSDPELRKLYIDSIEEHNLNATSTHPDSGFDLYLPESLSINPNTTCKIPLGIKCSMNQINSRSISFYMYPRSSISKTKLRLANSVGIIDSGYRGELMAVVDNISSNYPDDPENGVENLSKHSRLFQICSPNLEPINVSLVDDVSELGDTIRGEGGFGSTGV